MSLLVDKTLFMTNVGYITYITMKKALFLSILMTPFVSFASPIACAPGDIFNIENGQKCPVISSVTVPPTYQDLLNTIESLNKTVDSLESQIKEITSDSNNDSDKIKEIVKKISDIDDQIDELGLSKICATNIVSKKCINNTRYEKQLNTLKSQKYELQKEYAILKGDVNELPQ